MKPILSIIFIFFFNFIITAQQPNDCQFAVTVCGNSDFSLDVSGIGTQELSGSNSCGLGESNSIWLEVNIATSGTLAFTLTPGSTDINEDYDFYIFDAGNGCGNIGQAIRCSTTNPVNAMLNNNLTGLNTTETDVNEGPGPDGNSFVSAIDVIAGDSYFIVIDRPIGNSPFSLNWTGTASFPAGPSNPLLAANPTSTSLPNLSLCDDFAPFDDNIVELDFTTLTQDIINGVTDVAVTYHNSESDANINVDALSDVFNNTTNNQDIYIRIENTTTGCFIINNFRVNVSSLSNFNVPSDYIVCDNDLDGDDQNGSVTFDFNLKTQEITNGISGVNYFISYHLSQAEAEGLSVPLPLLYTNTTPTPTEIFVRIEDVILGCIGYTTFNIMVDPIPIANDISILQCDEDGIPEGFTTFNIMESFDAVTGGDPNSIVKYYLSLLDADNEISAIDATDANAFNNFFNPQTIYARVTNTATGCDNISEISLEVSTTSSNNANIELCDTDGTEDGFMIFNLADANTTVLSGAPVGLDLVYYETYENALVETNALGTTFTNTIPYHQIIYARVENANACYGISEIELTVFELPNIETEFETIYCLNFFPETIILNGGVLDDSPSNYYYEWLPTGETTSEIEISAPGTYNVRVTNTNGCYKDRTIRVFPSNMATDLNFEVVDASENNIVSVIVSNESVGDYEYALNNSDGPYQDSSTFYNVQPGLHTVYVRDKNNCGIADDLVSVIGFPKFFTPNNDFKNDYWQVKGISSQFQTNTSVFIYDRYGKLLIELNPLRSGWDGTYNGEKMPTSDYWFKVKLQDGRIFTSHFTLKR